MRVQVNKECVRYSVGLLNDAIKIKGTEESRSLPYRFDKNYFRVAWFCWFLSFISMSSTFALLLLHYHYCFRVYYYYYYYCLCYIILSPLNRFRRS